MNEHNRVPCPLAKAVTFVFACAAASSALDAHALDRPRAQVIPARAGKQHAALEREVRRALEELDRVELLDRAALDLEAAQLAIDCTETSAHCLNQVAKRMEARVLVIAAIERGSGRVKLRLSRFDARRGDEPRTVVRERPGRELDRALLDQIPDMLGELFEAETERQAPVKAAPEPEAEGEEAAPTEPAEPEPARGLTADDRTAGGGVPLGPLVLGVGGLGAFAAGLAVGAVMLDTHDRYAARVIDSRAAAEAAEDDRKLGERQAIVANVLLGAGAAALVAAGVWFAVEAKASEDEPAPSAALVPALSPSGAGVSLIGRFGGEP